MENEAHRFKRKEKKTKKIKTFAPEREWKKQTGNRRLRVWADEVIY